jgi:hypothetical protein
LKPAYSQEYAADPAGKWKSKDTAIYLLTSIASRGSTQQVHRNRPIKKLANVQLGVTSTNMLVDVVAFFGQNVFTDLQAAPGSVHPILIVDAIKYLYTFRNQASIACIRFDIRLTVAAHKRTAGLGPSPARSTSQLGQLRHLLLCRHHN